LESAYRETSLLKSLIPKTQEDLSRLRFLLHCAHLIQRGAALPSPEQNLENLLGQSGTLVLNDYRTPGVGLDLKSFLLDLSEESRRYFHGLVEAMEIYQSIHGQSLSIHNLTLSDQSVYELRQIRDMCLEEGLRSIY
jgi:hypothetical protein